MRHGMMLWREDELSICDVTLRQQRLQKAIADAGLDAMLIYTNHVRSAGVTYISGFTPYWSDGLLLVLRDGPPIFLTALSKRVGDWIRSVNPTVELAHSPFPGKLVGERLGVSGARRLGVVELDRLPGGLVDEINSHAPVEFSDATAIFTAVRATADHAELNLVARADAIARNAFASGDLSSQFAGDFTGPVERAVRLAGAEECYVAVAPDLSRDRRFIRTGKDPLGATFAVRLSVAYNGVWIRRIDTFSTNPLISERLRAASDMLDQVFPGLPADGSSPAHCLAHDAKLLAWHLEAPHGTRPLKIVADNATTLAAPIPYGNLTVVFDLSGDTVVAARPVGLGHGSRMQELAA